MKTKKLLLNLILCSIFVPIVSCQEDDDNEPEAFQVYVQSSGQIAELYNSSTINFLVGDTLVLVVDGGVIVDSSSLGDYVVQPSSNLNVALSDTADNVYYITASESGTGDLFIADETLNTYNSDLSSLTYVFASVVVHNPKIRWKVQISVNDTIETGDETLNDEIRDALLYRDIDFPSSYIFEYLSTDFPRYGTLQAIFANADNQRDTVTGSFIEQLKLNDTVVSLNYNDQISLYTYRKLTATAATITEDVTEEYQNLYPDATISKVKDVSSVQYSEVTLELVENSIE